MRKRCKKDAGKIEEKKGEKMEEKMGEKMGGNAHRNKIT